MLINCILYPKREGLKAKQKPVALLLHSENDDAVEMPIDYSSSAKLLDELGYGSINKKKLKYNQIDPKIFDASIKPVKMKGKPLTLWLESHGATGWLFSGTKSIQDELNSTLHFAQFVKAIESYTGAIVVNIVLSGCYTANEFLNIDGMSYLNSPSRMLSLLLPDKHILGFVGQNASAKVTHVYTQTGTKQYKPTIVNLENAAVLFQNGQVIESFNTSPEKEIYCKHDLTPSFIIDACELDFGETHKSNVYYLPCLPKEKLEKITYIKPDCYGKKQLQWITSVLESECLEFVLQSNGQSTL